MADISKITVNNTEYTLKDSNAVHIAGSETITGGKTFSNSIYSRISGQYKIPLYIANNANTNGKCACIRLNMGNASNQTTNQLAFIEYSPKSTADGDSTGYYETFYLPAPNVGLSSNPGGYAIYTSKNLKSNSASSGGTAVSLCTTGEKYTWNNKGNIAVQSWGKTLTIPSIVQAIVVINNIAQISIWPASTNTVSAMIVHATSSALNGFKVSNANGSVTFGLDSASGTGYTIARDNTNNKMTITSSTDVSMKAFY